MSRRDEAQQIESERSVPRIEGVKAVGRAFRYLGIRVLVVSLTVMAGVYAAIWVTNLGGHADEQRRDEIEHGVMLSLVGVGSLPEEEQEAVIDQALAAAFAAADLDKPFIVRSFRYFREAFTFSLGEVVTPRGRTTVLLHLLERLPWTLLIFGVGNAITFILGLWIALSLARRYGSLFDRTMTLLVPLFAAPPWFHGLFLIVIFAALARILPFGGFLGPGIPKTDIGYVLNVLWHMILPVTAFVLGTLPFAVYANRSLFLVNASEDYVEQAKAKGLSPNRLQRRYILRPLLPAVVTNFTIVSLVSWQSVILTEYVFNWPGLGLRLIEAIMPSGFALGTDLPVVIGAVTMFAYLLGFTVILLDILYVIIDPRVSIRGGPK
jgi:peptide/nickel transport system permease protein